MDVTATVRIINGMRDGPRIGIMALTHGDELAGLAAHAFLDQYFAISPLQTGQVLLINANIEAWRAGTRSIRHDMNRLFLKDGDPALDRVDRDSYDFRRSRELMPILAGLDFLLDIHNTTRPSTPFSLVMSETSDHYQLAKSCPVDFFVSGFNGHVIGTSCDWVDQNGGIGVGVECGYQHDREGDAVAIACCKSFLGCIGVPGFPDTGIHTKRHLTIQHHEMVMDRHTFEYLQAFQNFDPIKPGELIAKDAQREYRAPNMEGLVIVFPVSSKAIRDGSKREAFFLGCFSSPV